MECDICGNLHSADHAFLCPACARASLYPHRINYARLLLEKEKAKRRTESIIHGPLPAKDARVAPEETSDHDAKNKWAYESNLADIYKGQERVDKVVRKSQELNAQIEQYKDQIEKRRNESVQRKQSNVTASVQLSNSNPAALDTMKKSVRRKTLRYDNLTQDIIAARTFLCKEAANLAGLQRYQRKTPEGVVQESFVLSGLPVVDLRDLNETPPQRVTASLSNVARLLVQTCYYLGVRLPAEITLPKENYFHATIYSPTSSYLPRKNEPSIPGVTSSNASSPSASRTIDQQSQAAAPKPRPLFLNKKLTVLMRDHPAQYSHFVEGVSLLAWNVAWLCRMQGLPIATSDWEEICAIGRNLWLLLINQTTLAQQQQQRLQQQQQQQQEEEKGEQEASSKSPRKPTGTPTTQAATTPNTFAYRSHSTSYDQPTGVSNPTPASTSNTTATHPPPTIDVTARTWKFASPLRLADKLKAHLLDAASGADWEVLSSREFAGWMPAGAAKLDDDPVMVPVTTEKDKDKDKDKDKGKDKDKPAAVVRVQRDKEQRRETGDDNAGGGLEHERLRAAPLADAQAADDPSSGLDAGDAQAQARPRGTSGWTKLKSRSGPQA